MPKKRKRAAASRRTPRINWRKSAVELASCAVWALKCMKPIGSGSGMLINLDPKSPDYMKTSRWEEKFFNALDGIGVVYDRKAYYAASDKKRRRS